MTYFDSVGPMVTAQLECGCPYTVPQRSLDLAATGYGLNGLCSNPGHRDTYGGLSPIKAGNHATAP